MGRVADRQQNSSDDRSAGTAALSGRFRLHRTSGDHGSPAHVWTIAVMLTAVSLVSLVVAANIAERWSWTHNIAYLLRASGREWRLSSEGN